MKILKEHQEEYLRCIEDAKYFLKTYCTVKTKEMVTREEISDKELEEVKHIYFKYFSGSEKEERLRLMEKVTHEDGECNFVLYFKNSPYKSAVAILYEDVMKLLRKEKLEKLCEKIQK